MGSPVNPGVLSLPAERPRGSSAATGSQLVLSSKLVLSGTAFPALTETWHVRPTVTLGQAEGYSGEPEPEALQRQVREAPPASEKAAGRAGLAHGTLSVPSPASDSQSVTPNSDLLLWPELISWGADLSNPVGWDQNIWLHCPSRFLNPRFTSSVPFIF